MNSNIRFIASSKLSQAELPFVLTPDECIEQFSRVRNPNDILKSLPSALAQRISLSAKKSTTGLLQSMQTELAKVEWIAISLSPRRGGMSDSQLSRYPKLKAYIDSVIFTGKARTRKAGYQPVVDDVVLAREYTHVPVEPSPEHKIVVEFAGQWSSSAACLLLSKTDNQHEKITAPAADKENAHRSLATFKGLEPEGKTLYIKIPCKDQPMPILLKLAEGIEPVEKDTKMTEWDNVLVPVLPMYFPTSEQSDAAGECFKSGYIYVIWNNKVWREMVIDEHGFFSDTDIMSRRTQTGSPKRHADIVMLDKELGCVSSYEPYEVVQGGRVVFKGAALNGVGEARLFNLTDEEVEVRLTHYDPQKTFTVKTQLSPTNGAVDSLREPLGFPMSHIWLPYKIQGEPQTLFMKYSTSPLNESELCDLENDPETLATEITDLDKYSQEQTFQVGEGKVRLLSTLPTRATEHPVDYRMIKSQINQNIAVVYLDKAADLVFEYPSDPSLDESDDYFELKQSEGEWSQRVYLRQCTKNSDGSRLVRFSSWPEEVKEVDLIRGYLGHSHHQRENQTFIFNQMPIEELMS